MFIGIDMNDPSFALCSMTILFTSLTSALGQWHMNGQNIHSLIVPDRY